MKKLILLSFLFISSMCFSQVKKDTTACILLVTSKFTPFATRIEGYKVLISIPEKSTFTIVKGKVVWTSNGKYKNSIIYLDEKGKELNDVEIWGIFQK